MRTAIWILLPALVAAAGCEPRGDADTAASSPMASQPAAAPPPATLAADAPAPTDRTAGAAASTQHTATGTVTAMEEGTITLSHGAIPTLDWPAMTMPFEVRDAALLEGVQVGDEVRFSFAQEGTRYVISSIDTD